MRWLRGVLVALAVVACACDDGKATPLPAADSVEAQRFCNQLKSTGGSENDLEKVIPDALKGDFDSWRHGNDPEKKHVGRLNDFTHKACGVPFDEPGFTTTTAAPTSTSATVAP